ncbi:Uncharacterized protein PBTT_08474 [Plasmodiophora brassicae]|uniref:Uncharacterized protein n=1 Tax=Plasmodiophora brassicae TaxID=37360 RepID=A0A3P3YIU4_PLABS|nr:unnamed protein product [Plasmodiophora brassicae]
MLLRRALGGWFGSANHHAAVCVARGGTLHSTTMGGARMLQVICDSGRSVKVHYFLAYRDRSLVDQRPSQIVMDGKDTAQMFLQAVYDRTPWLRAYDISKFRLESSNQKRFRNVKMTNNVTGLGSERLPIIVIIPAYPPTK